MNDKTKIVYLVIAVEKGKATVLPHRTAEKAIEDAKDFALSNNTFPEDNYREISADKDEYRFDNCLFCAEYNYDGDHVWVSAMELFD